MYQKQVNHPEIPEIDLYIEGKLDPQNKWIQLSKMIPWEMFDDPYMKNFKDEGNARGTVAFDSRTAIGALIIKQMLSVSDREVVSLIQENPYLQYFIGIKGFQPSQPFDPSMMTYFRKRVSQDMLIEINEIIISQAQKKSDTDTSNSNDGSESDDENKNNPPTNKGSVAIDASCTPADIKYPTDWGVVYDALEITESLIDEYRSECPLLGKRPRTKKEINRKNYLKISKHPRTQKKNKRKYMLLLINALKRNLKFLQVYENKIGIPKDKMREALTTARTIYAQQEEMWRTKTHRIDNRIVNAYQPHVRPIVRGKAGKNVEFGAKITIATQDGYTRLSHFSWEAYNEASVLKTVCENYFNQNGYYPEAVLVDKIFRNRENRQYCKKHGIRITGKPLGRPPKEDILAVNEQYAKDDNAKRNAVEGKFGQCKRRFGLDRIMARRKDCSETVIMMGIIVANLQRWLDDIFFVPIFVLRDSCTHFIAKLLLLFRLQFCRIL